jgi:hypothetical protein
MLELQSSSINPLSKLILCEKNKNFNFKSNKNKHYYKLGGLSLSQHVLDRDSRSRQDVEVSLNSKQIFNNLKKLFSTYQEISILIGLDCRDPRLTSLHNISYIISYTTLIAFLILVMGDS